MISSFRDARGKVWSVLEKVEYQPPGSRQGTIRPGYLCQLDKIKLIFDASHYYIDPTKNPVEAKVIDAQYTYPHYFLIVRSENWEVVASRDELICLINGTKVAMNHFTTEQLEQFCRVIGAVYRSTCGLVHNLGFWGELSPEQKQLVVDIGYADSTAEPPKPQPKVRRRKRCRFVQLDTYRASDGHVKEQLEEALEPITVNQDWYPLTTEEWEGNYSDYGPPIHTWFLTDKSENQILKIARTIDIHAEVAGMSEEWITSESQVDGMVTSYRPDHYLDIDIDDNEFFNRFGVSGESYYLSYGLRGWHSWRVECARAKEKSIPWTPSFPTQLQFPEEKLIKLFQKIEKLRDVWEWDLEIPSKQNLMAMIGIEEIIQVARYGCDMEVISPPKTLDEAEQLLDLIIAN